MRVGAVTKRAPGGEGKPLHQQRRTRRAALALGIGVATLLTTHGANAAPLRAEPAPTLSEQAQALPADSLLRQENDLTPEQLIDLGAQGRAASRHQARASLPGCSGLAPTADHENGHLPEDVLCALPWVEPEKTPRLRADAAVAFARLNAEFGARFGRDLCVNDTYRDFEYQAAVKQRRGGFAAPAGSSTHGWGLAVDLCEETANADTEQWQWVDRMAPQFGFVNPDWARKDGSGPYEPWHWEFASAVAVEKEKRAQQLAAQPVQPPA